MEALCCGNTLLYEGKDLVTVDEKMEEVQYKAQKKKKKLFCQEERPKTRRIPHRHPDVMAILGGSTKDLYWG